MQRSKAADNIVYLIRKIGNKTKLEAFFYGGYVGCF